MLTGCRRLLAPGRLLADLSACSRPAAALATQANSHSRSVVVRTASTEWTAEELEQQRLDDAAQRQRSLAETEAFRKAHYPNDRHPDLKQLLSGPKHKSYKWGVGQRLALKRLLLLPAHLKGTLDVPEFILLGKRVVDTGDWSLFDHLWSEYESRRLPRDATLDNVRLNYLACKGDMPTAWQFAGELKQRGSYNHFSDMHLLLGMLRWQDKFAYSSDDIHKFFLDMAARRQGSDSWPSPMVVGQLVRYWTQQRNYARVKEIVAPLGDRLTHHVLPPLIAAHWQLGQDWSTCHLLFERYRAQNSGKVSRAAWREIEPVWQFMKEQNFDVPRLQE